MVNLRAAQKHPELEDLGFVHALFKDLWIRVKV